MKSVEVSAKRVNDAINDGLAQLGITLAEAKVEVLSTGGLFKKAKVRISVDEPEDKRPAPKKPVESKPFEKAQKPEAAKPENRLSEKPAEKKEEKGVDKRFLPKTEKAAAEKPARPQREKQERPQKERPQKVEHVSDEEKFEEPIVVSDEIIEKAKAFASETLRLMGIADVGVNAAVAGKVLKVELMTEDSAAIGYRGETLDAIEHLIGLIINSGEEGYVKIRVDCSNYRSRREESLKKLAVRMAEKCVKSGRKVSMEPMNSSQRRIIHATLSGYTGVVTKSEGREPARRVIIYPKRQPQAAPAGELTV